MCGIGGCVAAPGGAPDLAALEAMAGALEARGPDGSGIHVRHNAGLVHRRLAIVDPSEAGAQPISDPAERWTLSFNGEVYNHLELRGELPGPWRGHSDTETLVHALTAWEAGALPRCNGPLAIAALDHERRRLLLARDRFGKKPLYIARDDRGLWFASEMRALLAAGLRPGVHDENLAHGCFRGWLAGGQTPLRGVERLMPGRLRWVDLDTLAEREEEWFHPAELVDPDLADELAGLSREALRDRLHALLDRSVERRLMSDVPVGAMLSGGLDSSLVTALAARRSPGFTAFTAAIPFDRSVDESHHARAAADAIGVPLETVAVEAGDFARLIVPAVHKHEYPMLNAGIAFIEPVAARARDMGFKVLLTGEASDELFGGYEHMYIEETRAFLPAWTAGWRGTRTAAQYGRTGARAWLRRAGLVRPRPHAFPRAGVVSKLIADERQRGRVAYASHDGERAELEGALLSGLRASGFGHLLNRMDKNAMAASIETRLPFLDPDVARFALNVPLEHRVARQPKRIVRDVARLHLPRGIARRRKQNSMGARVGALIGERARTEFLADGLLRDQLRVPRKRWDELIGPGGAHSALWPWTGEIWMRLFAGGRSPEQVQSELLG